MYLLTAASEGVAQPQEVGMRRVVPVVLCLSLLAVSLCDVHAEPEKAMPNIGEAVSGMGKKLVRGLVNTTTGIVELPMQTYKGYKEGLGFIKNEPTSKAVGTVLGFFRGVGHAAGRTCYGVVDVAAFWSANPEDNEGVGIPLDAEYAWEMGERYSVLKPNLKEGLMPYPRKIVRGLANGLLGIVEVPGQIVKRAKAERPLIGVPLGVAKGLWFWTGRTIYGYGDAVLFLVPNPEDQLGYGFEEEWPWSALVGSCD